MLKSVEHQHDHVAGKGGFWVRPDGSTVPVKTMAGHYDTADQLHRDGELSGGSYDVAYAAGWARISLGIGRDKYVVSCQDVVSPAALREAMKLLRHYRAERPVAEFEVYPSDANSDRCYAVPYETRRLPDGEWPRLEADADKVYRLMSSFLLKRIAEIKRAVAPQGELELHPMTQLLLDRISEAGLCLRSTPIINLRTP